MEVNVQEIRVRCKKSQHLTFSLFPKKLKGKVKNSNRRICMQSCPQASPFGPSEWHIKSPCWHSKVARKLLLRAGVAMTFAPAPREVWKKRKRVDDFTLCMEGGHYSVSLSAKRPVQASWQIFEFTEGTAVATLFWATSPYPSGFPFGQSPPQLLASQITCKQPALFCPERHCPWWPLSNKESAQTAWVLRPAHHKSPCPPARSHCEAAKYKPSVSPLLRSLTLRPQVKSLFLKAGNARSGAACHHSARPKALSYTSRSNRVYDFFSSVARQEGQKTRIAKKSYCGQSCCQSWGLNHLPLLGQTT